MNIKEVQKVVSQIKGNLFKRSNSYSIGTMKSHFRGNGLQFKEHRVYSQGDEIRFIDWKLYAKTGESFVKTFEEERNIEITVILDASPTMYTGFEGISKIQAAIEIICLLYLLANETKDLIHVLLISDDIMDLPRARGERGIISLINMLEKKNILNSSGKVNIRNFDNYIFDEQKKEKALLKHIGKRREIVILSDFNDFMEIEKLKRLVYSKSIHGFQILGPMDRADELPYRLMTSNNVQLKNSKEANVNLSSKKTKIDEMFGAKLKRLYVDGRYLEDFVREMV
jgi:uncharacterized protein (DUF58 family)